MRKVLATALVALMVASTVFAGFAGSADVKLGYNFDDGNYGFDNSSKIEGTFDFHTDAAENKGEGSIYAGIKASMKVAVEKVSAADLKVAVSLDEAYVAGENFKVSLLGNAGGLDLATSAIDVNGDKKAVTYALPYAGAKNAVKGISGTVYGYGFGFGLVGNAKNDTFTTAASFVTPDYTLAEGLTLKLGAHGAFDVKTSVDNQAGFGVKVAYAGDLKASLASDMGLLFTKGADDKVKTAFDADVAANVAYNPVSVDLYYATNANVGKSDAPKMVKNLLSVKVAADLKDYAPVTVAFTGKDLVNKQDLGASVGVKLADIKLNASVNGGYVVADKTWSAGADVDYTIDQVGKIYAGFGLEGAKELSNATVKVGLENTTLINNATLKAEYASGNLVDKKAGSLTTSCTVKF